LATPPEFYLDENAVTRSVRRRLEELGYTVDTSRHLLPIRRALFLPDADADSVDLAGNPFCDRAAGRWRLQVVTSIS